MVTAVEPLALRDIGYFSARQRNRLHETVLQEWFRLRDGGMTLDDLAVRMRYPRERVAKLLGAPGNWSLDTVSRLLLAMGAELEFTVKPVPELLT